MSVNVKLYCGDNRVSLRRLIDEGVRVHSVVTDPPYGLVSVQKRFGAEGAAPALMQCLIRHITPPGGTVLDPFAGSGTTAEAAKREGFNCILMEAEDEYVEFLRHGFAGDFFCNVEVHDASSGE